MATTKDHKKFILDQLSSDNVTCRQMMGEYLLYYNGILFGGIYDDRLLIKKVHSNKKYQLEEAIPYEGKKIMYLVDVVDNCDLLKKIVIDTYNDLIKDTIK